MLNIRQVTQKGGGVKEKRSVREEGKKRVAMESEKGRKRGGREVER